MPPGEFEPSFYWTNSTASTDTTTTSITASSFPLDYMYKALAPKMYVPAMPQQPMPTVPQRAESHLQWLDRRVQELQVAL